MYFDISTIVQNIQCKNPIIECGILQAMRKVKMQIGKKKKQS
jgi:hypothetical protein